VHHDMGLILGNLTPVMHGLDLWVMPPQRFITEPRLWLSCFGELGATRTAAPSFGLGYVARKVRPTDLGGMDFSGWKSLICGAERVSADVLSEFVKLVGPAGFNEQSILPSYGMAEATLGISGKTIGSPTKKIRVAPSSLRMGQTVEVVSAEDSGTWHVGCGLRIDPSMTIEIRAEDGSALGAGMVGEIAVSGSSVAAGYYADTIGSTARFEGDTLYTGDAGFLYEGELFIVGRLGDSVKVRGKSVFAEDTDAIVHSVAGLGSNNAVSLLGFLEDQESIIALVEKPTGEWVSEVAKQLSAQYTSMRVVVIAAGPGTLMRTTSGKPRRTAMWQNMLERWDATEFAFDSATVLEPSG
ncbi:MAG: fatty acyl-AMP ligase, partial [Rhodococcus sp.]|nr:fatty acyl-AMP ligase [Rhodococcus sp. (in: high G+C Gram-positive bacteria)]